MILRVVDVGPSTAIRVCARADRLLSTGVLFVWPEYDVYTSASSYHPMYLCEIVADLSNLMVVTTSKPRPEPEWLKEYTGKRSHATDKRDHATVSVMRRQNMLHVLFLHVYICCRLVDLMALGFVLPLWFVPKSPRIVSEQLGADE